MLAQEVGLDLVVIDSLASFLPGGGENSAGAMLDFLLPLQRLTALGLSVLLVHQPRKGETLPGQAARGSGALPSYVDVVVEMGWHGRPSEDDRRRRLTAYSRHPETPRRLVIELAADGTDYVSHGDLPLDGADQGWEVLQGVLEDAPKRLTRREVLGQWPQDHPKPDETTLWRWLERAVAEGRVKRDGTGRRKAPFRDWLPGKEAEWGRDPFRADNFEAWVKSQQTDFGMGETNRKGGKGSR